MNDIEKSGMGDTAAASDSQSPQSLPEVQVSVIVPIYNAYDYLGVALDSILCQTLKDIEVICIDDGSTDRSLDIIKKYHEADSRVRVVTENNAGVSTARNKGIVRARGEYIIFLDADDFYEPTLLEKLYNLAKKENLDIALSKFDIYNSKTERFSASVDEKHVDIYAHGAVVSKNEFPDYIFESATGYVWNKLFRTSFLREKDLEFDPELHVFEDVHFVCSAMALAERVGRIDPILMHHRVYADQSRARFFRKHYDQVPVVYSKVKQLLMQKGMYVPLKKSFLNLSASRCYKIYNLLWADGKETLWNLLHDSFVTEFGWLSHEKGDFESAEVCEFVANVSLYTHAEYLEREEKGKNINVDELEEGEITKKVNQKQKISRRRAAWNKIMSFINIFRGLKKKK